MTPSVPTAFDAYSLATIAFFIALVPMAAVVATSYLKITVVLGLLRHAIGVQQVPANMVINGIALVISAYVMAPIGMQAMEVMQAKPVASAGTQKFADVFEAAQEPYRQFLMKHAHDRERQFFLKSAMAIWPPDRANKLTDTDLIVLAPAFTLSELTEAFKVGFALYMAFVVIDLIMANLLLALGLSQLNPTNIAIPFKLLMFVVMDGWSVLTHSLVLSYR